MSEAKNFSFGEYVRNRDKFIRRDDESFGWVDKGSTQMGHMVKKHVYEIEGYRCKTLEEVERIARAQGIPIKDLDYQPEVIPLGGGKCNILIKFVSKEERVKREAWR